MNMDSYFSTVPAFPTKLWALVEDPSTNDSIRWDASGKSFHIVNQIRFAREILPQYFKHNNINSFIRQLNMYGFRKVLSTESLSMKSEKEELTFAHHYFQQGQEHLLENIKRKTPSQSQSVASFSKKDASKILGEVSSLKNQLDSMTDTLENLRVENEVLWKEVVNLRQKHARQQQVVSKLVQFFISIVNKEHNPGTLKRKLPLMIKGPSNEEGAPITVVPKMTQSENIISSQVYPSALGSASEDRCTTGKEVRPRVFYLKKNLIPEDGKLIGKDGRSKILYVKQNAVPEQVSKQLEPFNVSSENQQQPLYDLLDEFRPQNGDFVNYSLSQNDLGNGLPSKELEVMKHEPRSFKDFDKEEFSRNLKSCQNTLENVCDFFNFSQDDLEGSVVFDNQLELEGDGASGAKKLKMGDDFSGNESYDATEEILGFDNLSGSSTPCIFQKLDDDCLGQIDFTQWSPSGNDKL